MTLQLEFPEEVLAALGPQPQREILEGVLLYLVQQNRMTVAKAGSILGMDRMEAVRWYTQQGFYFPDLHEDDLQRELEHAKLP